jgi:hypothetical protein
MRIISKDITLVRATDGVVAHQCNCMTVGAAKGVAQEIFRAFPYANIYRITGRNGWIGSADIRKPKQDKSMPVVVNLMAQYYPGKCVFMSKIETPEDRLKWLDASISDAILRLKSMLWMEMEVINLFIPFKMGCRLAGGEWDQVEQVILKHENERVQFTACLKS